MGAIKDKLIEALDKLSGNGLLKTSRGDNSSQILGRVFIWQETVKYAEQQLKGAWQAAVAAEVIPDDDTLREGSTIGDERIRADSKHFSLVTKVSAPRELFSRDKYITAVAKRFKLDQGVLNAMAIECMEPSKAPLSKRVLEV